MDVPQSSSTMEPFHLSHNSSGQQSSAAFPHAMVTPIFRPVPTKEPRLIRDLRDRTASQSRLTTEAQSHAAPLASQPIPKLVLLVRTARIAAEQVDPPVEASGFH